MKPLTLAAALAVALCACETEEPDSPVQPSARSIVAARAAWDDVYSVLTHPRCMNCHPAGDAPLQTDEGTPHKWGVDRAAIAAGLECTQCHKDGNSDGPPDFSPPGAPNWHFPSAETPMVFEGRSPAALCAQLHDREATGGRDLDGLLEHVNNESLVLWAWDPGGDRTTPPLSHDAFLEAFAVWVQGGGACPEEASD